MKIIITGGAGFIGSHLAKELVKQGHSIKIIDNLSTGRLDNIKALVTWSNFLTRSQSRSRPKITFIKGDIRNLSLLKREFRGFDYVFHQAAVVSVPKSIKNPKICNDVNIRGTLNVLQVALDCKIKKVVFASSCAVYGDKATWLDKLARLQSQTNKETDKPDPQSPYALSKLTGEYYCQLFTKLYGLPTVILRYFNVYGLNQKTNSNYAAVIPSFLNRLHSNQRPIIYGTGKQSRDFVYIDDIVRANLLALRAPKILFGQIFNIGAGKAVSINQLLINIKKLIGQSQVEPIYKPAKAGDIVQSCADISKARLLLKYQPKIELKTGLSFLIF